MKAHASFNRCYRLLWSCATQQWKPVPETARTAKKGGRGSAANALTLAGVLPGVAMSLFVLSNVAAQPPPNPPAPAATQLPTGGNVMAGQATISQSALATAANMVVNQTSQRAVIDWSKFNLGSAATVQFVQPNAQSVILNRVLDPNPSQIFGRINANGQVFITNPYGVYFAPSATVDVGGLVATTYNIRNEDFMSGFYRFEGSGSTGRIVNEGALRASAGGYIALLAPEVQNNGVVLARAGTVAFASGDVITLTMADGKGLAGITTTASTMASLIENKLAVQAPDGQIILSAVAVNKLQGGVIKNSGSLEATSLTAKGGKIVLEADAIELTATATVDVSGRTGGGTVLMGGDWQGSGNLRQATQVSMAPGATINASATDNGDGGKVVLWSNVNDVNSTTTVGGTINANAGSQSGNGGAIETSGHVVVLESPTITASSKNGNAGLWLTDPADSTINATIAATYANTLNNGTSVIDSVAGMLNVSSAITTTSTGTVGNLQLVSTGGDINIMANIALTGTGSFTANAAGNIFLGGSNASNRTGANSINTSGGSVGLYSNSGGNTTVTPTANAGASIKIWNDSSINSNGGAITLGSLGATGYAQGGSGRNQVGVYLLGNTTLRSAGGNISISGSGAYSDSWQESGIEIDGGSLGASTLDAGTGNINLLGRNHSAAPWGTSSSCQSANGIYVCATAAAPVTLNSSGNLTLQGTAGYTSTNSTSNHDVNLVGAKIINPTNGVNITGDRLGFSDSAFNVSALNLLPLTAGVTPTLALSGNATVFNISSATTLNNNISGTGNLTQAGTGTLTLTNNSTGYTGNLTINSGSTLTLGDGGTNGSLAAANMTVNGTLNFNRSDNINVSSVFTGTGLINSPNSSGLTLKANSSSFAGNLSINTGSTVTLGDGGTNGSLNASIANNGTLNFNRSDSLTFSKVISGSGIFNQSGTGNITLSGNNTYTGNTTISAGVLTAGVNTTSPVFDATNGTYSFASAALGLGTIKVLSSASFNPNGKFIYNPIEIAGTGAAGSSGALWSQPSANSVSAIYGNITLMADNTRLGSSYTSSGFGSTLSLYGDIKSLAGNSYGFSTAGTEFVKLYGGKSITGNISVGNGYTFQLLPNGANATFSNNFTIASGSKIFVAPSNTYSVIVNGSIGGAGDATLDAGAGVIASWLVNGTYDLTGNTALYNSGTLTLNSTTSYTLSSNITTNVTTTNLTQAGAGTLTIASNLSSFTGTLKVNAGSTVNLGNGSTSGTTAGAINVYGTVNINRSDNISLSSVLSGNGLINKVGSNVLTLSGLSNFSGNITVGAGTLKSGVTTNATGFGAFGKDAFITLTDATGVVLDLNSYSTTIGALTGGANTTLNVSLYTATIGSNNASTTFSGQLLGSGIVNKTGTGTFTLSGNSSAYTGGLEAYGGTLLLTNTTVVGNGTKLFNVTGSAGTLELQNISSLSNPINWASNGSLLISSGNTTLNGNLTSGNNILPRVNIEAGRTLNITGNMSMGSNATLNKDGAGTLLLSETATTSNQSIKGLNLTAGMMEVNSSKIKFAGSSNNTIGPGAVMKLDVFNSAMMSNTDVYFINNGLMQFTPTSAPNNYFSGTMSGTGSVEIMGPVITRIGKGGTYTGTTTIKENASASISYPEPSFGDGNSTLTNNGTLYLTAGGADWNQSIGGTGNVVITSSDANIRNLGMLKASTYTGTTTIGTNAKLYLGGNNTAALSTTAALGTGDIILNHTNAALTISRASNITLANNISGIGNLEVANSNQTATFTGNINITGNLSVGLRSTLKIGTTGVLGSNGVFAGAISFANANGTFEYAGASDLKLTGNITEQFSNMYGVLRKSTSNSTLIVTGNNNLTGATYIEAGTLYAIGSNMSTGKLGTIGNISNNATLVFNHSDAGNLSLSFISGNISGTGNVTFMSVGNITIDKTINLSGANSTVLLQSNGNLTVNSSLATSGANGKISLLAGAATAAGTGTGGQIAINNTVNVTLNNSGTVVLFEGNNSSNLTATLDARIVGANTTGVAKYKTYNTSINNLSSAIAGTRNYFYRVQPNVTLSGGTITATKVYDGTNVASPIYTPSGGNVTGTDGDLLTGRVMGATYNSSSAGTGKTLNLTLEIVSANTSWNISGYNGSINTTTTTTTANITKAPLTVKANDDARFVTFSDTVGYAGASYSGFVNNETLATSGVTGTLAIARNSASNAAGTYALTPSGLSANNYNISFANGTYTIVPAQQLIVRVNDGTSVYGNTPNLTVASASYLMPDNVTIVNLTGNLSVSGAGLYSLQDGASGSASFNLGLNNPTLSTSNHAAVGVWNVGYSNLNKVGVNFNNMTVVGTQTITQRFLNVTATASNKEYDGGTNAGVVLANNVLAGDVVNVTADAVGVFANKNAGTGKAVTLSNITVTGGGDAGNYLLSSNVANTTANITPKALNLVGLTATDKVYDATTNASVAFTGMTGLVGVDDVQVASVGTFSDKNAGNGKTVTVAGSALSGVDAGNYQLSSAVTTASITPKALTVSGLSAVTTKVYDGTNVASPLGLASLLAAEAVGAGSSADGRAYSGDAVSINGMPTATYNSKDVATAVNISFGGITLTGAQAGNYVLTTPSPIAANITPAPLIVRANDDARFVTQSDAPGFAGASYSGFVQNENATTAGFGGTLNITRADTNNAAANYTLSASGITSTNYNVTFQNGTYTIVAADSMLIRVRDSSSVYGTAANLTVANISYLMPDNVTVVDLTSNLTNSNGLYSVQDGANGSASFNLTLSNPTLSQSGNVSVGIWHVGYSNLTQTGLNFNTAVTVGTQTVTAKALTVSASAANKVYDGNANITLTLNSSDVMTGDNISYAYSNASFVNKNAEINKTASATNITLGGADAGNYVIQNIVANATANITAKTLNVSGITAANKVYDGNTSATINTSSVTNATLVSGGMVAGDNVVVSAMGTFADKNVNTSILVTLNSTYSGADAGNYNFNSQANTTANITAKTLTISGITAADKVYDGNTTATTNIAGVTNAVLIAGGLVAGDNVTVAATSTFADKNVNTSKVVTLSNTYGGADVGNYNITSQTNTTANITAKALNISGITASNKIYDGNTSAIINTTGVTNATLVAGGMVIGDSVTVSATGAFADKNANLSKVVMLTSTYGGIDVSNYNITSQTFTQADITPKTLNISGITATNKVYDGNTTATINTSGVTNATLVSGGMVVGDNVTVSATGTFADKNTNTSKVVTLSSTYGGTDVANYNITSQVNTTANITAKALNISGITAADKVYDGNTNATINTSGVTNAALVLGGMVAGDNVTVSATGTFADKNTNTSKVVTLNSTYGGADAGNYFITAQPNTTANITAKVVTLTAPSVTRAYDGTVNYTTLAADLTALSSQLGVAGDSVTGITLAYNDKNVGSNKLVSASGVTLSDGNNGLNYNISYANSSVSSITPKALTLSGITADNKIYDGTTTATINTSGVTNATLVTAGMISGDTLTVSATGAFADKNAGTSKVVTLNSTYGGADAGNYNITSQANTTADITPKSLTVTGLSFPSSKVYDGTTSATPLTSGNLQSASSPGAGNSTDGKPYTGDTVNLAGTPTGTYNSKDVATAANVSISGLSLSGSGAGNYVLSSPTPIAATITPAPLVVRANDDAKFVTLSDTVGYAEASYNGFVNSETFATSGITGALAIARSDSANGAAGSYTLTPSGLNASNYNLTYQTGTYTIVPAQTLLIRVGSTSTLYGNAMSLNVTNASYLMSDNVTIVNLTSSLSMSNGLYTVQDGASGSASFNLGVSNVTMSGSGHVPVGIWNVGTSNLTKTSSNFVTLAAVGTQTVTAKSITVSASAANKAYDGNTNATVTLSSADVISGDAVSYGYSSASFASNSVEANKSVGITNISLAGGDAHNYHLQNLVANATADITAANNTNSGGGGGAGGGASSGGSSAQDDLLTSQRALAVTTQTAERMAPTRVITRPESGSNAESVQTPSLPRASTSGVLPIAVMEDNRMANLGMTYEQQPNDIRIQLTTAPAITAPPSTMLRFSGNFKTFLVMNDQGEAVSYQGAVVGKRLVILADTASAKRLARVDMQTVLAAAITTLGADQPISLSELESVVMDLR